MRFAYADPPYPGNGHRYPEGYETNHPLLIQHLVDEYPDGWALSTGSKNLRYVLALCPGDVRVMAWVKPWCSWKPNVRVAYAWEPVIVTGGRSNARRWKHGEGQDTTVDWVSAPMTMGRPVIGAKPDKFCWWLFSVWNARPGDELHDLFPGSGAVTRAWEQWTRGPRQRQLV